MNSITLRRVLVFSAAMLLLVATAQPASATTLAYDSFTRPDNTDLNANRSGVDLIAPTDWAKDAGDESIFNGRLRTDSGIGLNAGRTRDTSHLITDGFVGGDLSTSGFATLLAIRAKTDGTKNKYFAGLLSGTIKLLKVVNGSETVLATGSTFSPNTMYRIVLGAVGDQISVYKDGVLDIAITDTDLTSGHAGTHMDASADSFVDNFKVATTFEEANDPNPPLPTVNHPPDTSQARPSVALLWPPNHTFVPIFILDVTDPDDDPVTITITGIRQDEPVNGLGDGDTSPDGQGVGTPIAQVRAERAGSGNGRVYTITFEACDDRGGCSPGAVTVGVPLNQGKGRIPVNDGPLFDSTQP